MKIIFILFAFFIFLLVACTAFMPAMISSEWGKEKIINLINSQIPGSLSVDRLSLHWLGPQEIAGVTLKSADGETILSLKKGTVNSSLFRILTKDVSQELFQIDALNAVAVIDAQDYLNFEKALGTRIISSRYPEIAGIMRESVGKQLHVALSQGIENHQPTLSVQIQSELLNIPHLSFIVDKKVFLTSPTTVKFYCSPSLVEKIARSYNIKAPRLAETVLITAKFNQLSFPAQAKDREFLPDAIAIDAEVACSPIAIKQVPTAGDLFVNDLQVQIKGNSLSRANCVCNAIVSQGNVESIVQKVLGNQVRLTASTNLNLQSNNSSFLDLLNVNVSSNLAKMTLSILGSHLNFDRGVVLSDSKENVLVDITLTPETYAIVREQLHLKTADFTLLQPAHLVLRIHSLKMPWQSAGDRTIAYWKSAVNAEMTIDTLKGMDNKTQQTVTLNQVKSTFFSEDLSQQINFDVHTEGRTHANESATIAMLGTLKKGLTDSGMINHTALSLNLEASIANLPIPLLCQFICQDPKISQQIDAIIGSNVDAKINAQLKQMNGPLYIEMKGQRGYTVIDAQLSQGRLTLNKDFYAELTISPQLGRYVLQEFIPFLSGIQGSDHPLQFTIAKEGFSIPISPLPSVNTISIVNATLALGKVRFSNEGQLAKVLSLLTTASANEIMAWLTPIYFSLVDGLFTLQRVDMLISDRYPIAAWGTVSVPKDKVNLVIGLSGTAIRKAFNVSGVKSNYMLQIPLEGSLDNASINKSKAIARLSALVAQNEGGPPGMVLGTVLDITSGGLTEKKTPPPTTNPLPWSIDSNEPSESQEKHSNQTSGKQQKTLIEDIGKTAGGLIKKLFK